MTRCDILGHNILYVTSAAGRGRTCSGLQAHSFRVGAGNNSGDLEKLENEGETDIHRHIRRVIRDPEGDAEVHRGLVIDGPVGADLDVGAVEERPVNFPAGGLEFLRDAVVKGEIDGRLIAQGDSHTQAVTDGASGLDFTDQIDILFKIVRIAEAAENNGGVTGLGGDQRPADRVMSGS